MAQVNKAYEAGDQKAIEKLVEEFGQDPEAITGEDMGARLIKVCRYIAKHRRRLNEVMQELKAIKQTEEYQLWNLPIRLLANSLGLAASSSAPTYESLYRW